MNNFIKTLGATALTVGLMAGSIATANAADYTIRATANSNENDEDYDGLVVFKNFVEAASNGEIAVELFIGTQLCSKGAECLQGIADGSIDEYISTSGGAAGAFPYVQVLDLPTLWQMTELQNMFYLETSHVPCVIWPLQTLVIPFV